MSPLGRCSLCSQGYFNPTLAAHLQKLWQELSLFLSLERYHRLNTTWTPRGISVGCLSNSAVLTSFQLSIPKMGSSYLDPVMRYFRHAFQPMYPLKSRLTTSATSEDVDACLLRVGVYCAAKLCNNFQPACVAGTCSMAMFTILCWFPK